MAKYVTYDASPPSSIGADLGAFGSISVSFQPSGRQKVTRLDLSGKSTSCVGAAKIVRDLGTFSGTIRFSGENGYTTVDLGAAEGSLGTSLFRNCTTLPKKSAAGEPPQLPLVTSLSGRRIDESGITDFFAGTFTFPGSLGRASGALVPLTGAGFRPNLIQFDPSQFEPQPDRPAGVR